LHRHRIVTEDDLQARRPRQLRVRFEIAAARMIESWVAAGRMAVSAGEMRLAREFLEDDGWTVRDVPGARVQLVRGTGNAKEVSREDAVMMALRCLVRRA